MKSRKIKLDPKSSDSEQSKKISRGMDRMMGRTKIDGDMQDIIDYIKEKHKVPEKFKEAYLFIDYDFVYKLKEVKQLKMEVDYFLANTDKEHVKISRPLGVIKKEKYWLSVMETKDELYSVLFTNDLKSFEKDYFKGEVNLLDSGAYTLVQTPTGITINPIELKNITVPILNDDLFSKISKEIKEFINKEQTYVDHQLEYKRGYLFYGSPGSGKSTFLKYLAANLDAVSLICDAKQDSHISFIKQFLRNPSLRNQLKIVILEDIDGIDYLMRSGILNLLDGVESIHKVIFIATTNFPEKVDPALRDRPSRFDSFVEIGLPNENSRKELIKSFFKLKKTDLAKAVKQTEGFSGAYFKELFLISRLHSCDIFGAIEVAIKKMYEFNQFKESKQELKRERYVG